MQLTNYQNFFFASRPIPQTAEIQHNTRHRPDSFSVVDNVNKTPGRASKQQIASKGQPCIAGTNVNILPAGMLSNQNLVRANNATQLPPSEINLCKNLVAADHGSGASKVEKMPKDGSGDNLSTLSQSPPLVLDSDQQQSSNAVAAAQADII